MLLSCGRLSRHEDFSERSGGIPVWSTAAHGALTVRFAEGSFTVAPFRPETDPGGESNGP